MVYQSLDLHMNRKVGALSGDRQIPRSRTEFTSITLTGPVPIHPLLLPILLPALGQARRAARTVVCASNLRQIGIGWTLYAQDNNDIAVAARPATLPGDNLYWVGNGRK